MAKGWVAGPTQTASNQLETKAWEGHPTFARAVRFAIFIAPLVVAILASLWASRTYPPERFGMSRWVWWLGLSLFATVIVRGLERVTARLAPLAMLFRLSLIFPDQAPSRFSVALRTGSTRSVKRRLAEIHESGELFSKEDSYAEQMLELVAVLAEHDRMTRGHAERVRAYSELIGEEMGLSGDDLGKLRWAALLHDMGKLHVPAEILNKDGKPTDEEWAILREHPAESEAYLEPLAGWLGEWRHAAVGHHERWDGLGYPAGQAGIEIPLAARIVAVADAYDVMTSTRSYKSAMQTELARQEISAKAGSQFDPVVVRAFLSIGLGDLRRTAGPLAWLTNLPFLRGVPLGNAVTATASGAASGAVSGAASAATAAAAIAVSVVAGAGAPEIPPSLAFTDSSAPAIEITEMYGLEDEAVDGTIHIEGDGPFTIAVLRQPDSGRIAVAGGEHVSSTAKVDFTPNPHVHGSSTFALEVCDGQSRCTETTGTITLEPVDDPPAFGRSEITMDEGSSVLAELHIVEFDDEPVLLTVDEQPANASVSIEGESLRVTHDGTETTLVSVDISASDGLSTVVQAIDIEVIPVNDAPVFTVADFDVSEAGTENAVTRVGGTDPEGESLTYSISGGDKEHFRVDSSSGEVTVLGPLDHETDALYEVEFQAMDRAGLSTRSTARVTVLDVDESPSFVVPAAPLSIAEDALPGTLVTNGALQAEDPEGRAVRYSLVDLSNTFEIDANTGALSVAANNLNFEAVKRYTITIVASDTTSGDSTKMEISIAVIDLNDAPSIIPGQSFSISETSSAGEAVNEGVVLASDDDGDSIAFALDDPSGRFTIDENTGLISRTSQPVDFETAPSYDVSITLTDMPGGAQTTSPVTISIVDVNEAPQFVEALPQFYVDENSAIGTPTNPTSLTADDVDGDSLTYELMDPSGVLVIDSTTGALTVGRATLDYEAGDTFQIGLTVYDPGGLRDTVTATVSIANINEPPTIGAPASPVVVEENSPIGTPVATVIGIDPDGDEVEILVVGGSGASHFSVTTDGVITLIAPLDYETTSTYTLILEARDVANPALQASTTVTIDVLSQFGLSPSPFAGDVVFNEVLFAAHTSLEPAAGSLNEDFVELLNISGTAIDLEGWSLLDHPLDDPDPMYNTSHTYGPLSFDGDGRLVHWITPTASARSSAPSADHEVHADSGSRNSLQLRDDLFLYDDSGRLVAYMAWGDPTTPNPEVGRKPPSTWMLWEDSYESTLDTDVQTSLSLTADGGSASESACWELTGSGSAQDPGRCLGAVPTADRDVNAWRTNSVGWTNDLNQTLQTLVVSEFAVSGMAGALNDNFIELYNASPYVYDLRDVEVTISKGVAEAETISLSDSTEPDLLLPGEHLLLAQNNSAMSATADLTFTIALNGWNYAIEVGQASTMTSLDVVGSSSNEIYEGTGLPPSFRIAGRAQSFERFAGASSGSCVDTGNNAADFHKNVDVINPQGRAGGATFCTEPVHATGNSPTVVIREIQTGPAGNEDEFIELFNPSTNGTSVDLTDYSIREAGGILADLPAVTLAAGESFLLGGENYLGAIDARYTKNISRDTIVELVDDTGTAIDIVQFGLAIGELPYTSAPSISYQRNANGCAFTGSALQDFTWTAFPTPTVSGTTEPCS